MPDEHDSTPSGTLRPGTGCTSARTARRHGLDTRAILVEVGRRKLVAGQEDMITDIALDLAGAADA